MSTRTDQQYLWNGKYRLDQGSDQWAACKWMWLMVSASAHREQSLSKRTIYRQATCQQQPLMTTDTTVDTNPQIWPLWSDYFHSLHGTRLTFDVLGCCLIPDLENTFHSNSWWLSGDFLEVPLLYCLHWLGLKQPNPILSTCLREFVL